MGARNANCLVQASLKEVTVHKNCNESVEQIMRNLPWASNDSPQSGMIVPGTQFSALGAVILDLLYPTSTIVSSGYSCNSF